MRSLFIVNAKDMEYLRNFANFEEPMVNGFLRNCLRIAVVLADSGFPHPVFYQICKLSRSLELQK